MESPLDILSRAAGMVVVNSKRKFDQEDDEQPLDFSCKKVAQSGGSSGKRVVVPSREGSPPQYNRPSVIIPSLPTATPPVISTPTPLKKRLLLSSSHHHSHHRRHTSSSSSSSTEQSSTSTSQAKPRKLIKRKQISKNGPDKIKKQIQVDKSRRVVVISKAIDGDGVGGAVEEHFRRSLEKYGEKKEEGEDEGEAGAGEILKPLSVDDHFAKALGSETWKMIKKD